MLESDEDHALVAHALSGNRDAFDALVRRHEDSVFAMLYRQTGDDEATKDLAQESFVRAFRFLKTFRRESSFKTWITRIALNVSHSYFASRAYREKATSEEFEADRHGAVSNPAEEIDQAEKLRRVRRLIAELSAPLRETLVLVALEGKSYAEASEALSVPIGTIASRLNKAIDTLRQRVAEEGL